MKPSRHRSTPGFVVLVATFSMARIAHAQIIITEIMHSPGGSDALWEWVEVHNVSDAAVDLDGWVFDDDDESSAVLANISSEGGTRNTTIPARGAAILYPGNALEYRPERFQAAWGGGITLIGVQGFTSLNDGGDAIGLWPSHAHYMADAIPMTTSSPRRTFANAVATVDYATGFPPAAGRSIAWNGNGEWHSGANWAASQLGVLNAFASIETTISEAQINSTNDVGNPGLLPSGAAPQGLLITEIMYAPESPLTSVEYDEIDFEWVEIFNNSTSAINFAQRPHVFDDDDGGKLGTANLRSGSIAAGGVAILFNDERISSAEMRAIWGEEINFIPVDNWPSLNNTGGGDTIAIWPNYTAYNTEPTTGPGRTHQNAVAAVSYNTLANAGWPAVNNESSIWLEELSADPTVGTNWVRSEGGVDNLSWFASPIYEVAVDHEGGDIGSPGFVPSNAPGLPGDHNDDGRVDAADYVLWRKNPNAYGGIPAGYLAWRNSFGAVSPGARERPPLNEVPESASTWLFAIGVATWRARRTRQPRRRAAV